MNRGMEAVEGAVLRLPSSPAPGAVQISDARKIELGSGVPSLRKLRIQKWVAASERIWEPDSPHTPLAQMIPGSVYKTPPGAPRVPPPQKPLDCWELGAKN